MSIKKYLRTKFISHFYAFGIISICIWMGIGLALLGLNNYKEDPSKLFLINSAKTPNQGNEQMTDKTNKSNQASNKNKLESNKSESWSDLLIKPIITSEFNQIIFRGLFLLLIWILFFLLIPIASQKLKRFKLGNLEIEVNPTEIAVLQSNEIHLVVTSFLYNLTTSDVKGKAFSFVKSQSVDYMGLMNFLLQEYKKYYEENLDSRFDYEVIEYNNDQNYNPQILNMVLSSKQEKIPKTKNTPNPFIENRLILYIEFNFDESKVENEAYFIHLHSYSYQFDLFDKHTIQSIVNNFDSLVDLITQAMTIDVLSSQISNSENPIE